MSFLTCFWLFPQNEHFSRSPPSPMRATGTPPHSCSDHRHHEHNTAKLPCPASLWDRDTRIGPDQVSAIEPLREASTPSIRPYSTACSAVRILSRSMSRLTSSTGLPLCSE